MKKITLGAILLFSMNIFSQEIVYSENFGIGTTINEFQNKYPIMYDVNGTIMNVPNTNYYSTTCSDYSGASGASYVIVMNYLQIRNINTNNNKINKLQVGIRLGGTSPLFVEQSIDEGITWSEIKYLKPYQNLWIKPIIYTNILNCDNLYLRFRKNTYIGGTSYVNNVCIDDITITSTSSLATDSFEQEILSFYPNPAKDILYFTNTEDKKVRIIDILGKTVLNKTVSGSLDISDVSRGVYLIVIEKNTKSITRKLVIN